MEITEEIRDLAYDLIKSADNGDPPEGFMQLLAAVERLGLTLTDMPGVSWIDATEDTGNARVGSGNCVFLELEDTSSGGKASVQHQFDPNDAVDRGFELIILGVLAKKRRAEGLDPQIGSIPKGTR